MQAQARHVAGMNPRSDWLPALAAFEAAARHQNFAHAAGELHLTASAVSHHVRRLESRLGVALFQRHARGVLLTSEGRRLADAAGDALSDLQDVLQTLRTHDDDRDLVRCTLLHSLAHAWLVPRLPAFAAAHPHIRLVLETDVATARFDDAGPDLGIRYGPGHWPGLASRLLMDEALFPVASPLLPALAQARTPGAIARLPLLSDLARHGWADWFRAAGARGVAVAPRYAFSDSIDALEAAARGLGVLLARGRIAAPWLADGRLVALPGPRFSGRYAYHLVHPSRRRLRPAAEAFAAWVEAQARETDR